MVSPVVVCHQLRSPDNLASIARVMANFGLRELILSDPQTHEFRATGRMAVKAEPVLDAMAVTRDLDEALRGVVYAVGTTSRSVIKRVTPLSPEEAAERLALHAERGKVALVLGGEKRGLSDEELARCQDVLVIPTDDAQPSMNLSHAAAVLIYLCSRQSRPVEPMVTEGAPLELVQRMEEKMRTALLDAEFLNPQAPQHVLGELIRSLVRNGLTRREATLWMSAFDQVGREVKKRD